MRIFYEKDCDTTLIKQRKVCIIGYGSQGRAHALNLRDSGVKDLTIALRAQSASRHKAQQDGFPVVSLEEGAAWGDFFLFATPDETHQDLYTTHLEPALSPNVVLAFAHGLSIHFGLIKPKKTMDVVMIAPKGPGPAVRKAYCAGSGLACLFAVHQDHSGQAQSLALSYACGIGAGRSVILETTFKEECETDLFGEQAVLCGGIAELVRAAFEVLVESGYAPEMAYLECLHETKLITDLLHKGGLTQMNHAISNTAEWGQYISGPRIITDTTKKAMKTVLGDIQNGAFVSAWMKEHRAGRKRFLEERQKRIDHKIEEVGKKLRHLMKLENV